MDTKQCNKCKILLPLDNFSPNAQGKFKVASQCKQCKNKARDIYIQLDSKKCTICKEIKPITRYVKRRNVATGYRSECKDCTKVYSNGQYATNIQYKIAKRLRVQIRKTFIRVNVRKNIRFNTIIGCSKPQLIKHLFSTNNNSTGNISENDIDHIIPCTYFNLCDPYHVKICYHYTNLQLLPSHENRYIKRNVLQWSKTIVDKYLDQTIQNLWINDVFELQDKRSTSVKEILDEMKNVEDKNCSA